MFMYIIRTYSDGILPNIKLCSGGRKALIGELEMIGQKTLVAYFKVVSRYLPGIIGNARKIQQENSTPLSPEYTYFKLMNNLSPLSN
jgi:hypothetical protein